MQTKRWQFSLLSVLVTFLLLTVVLSISYAQSTEEYVVKRGDTLIKIANAHQVTVKDLVEANELSNKDVIYVGQKLIIPNSRFDTRNNLADKSPVEWGVTAFFTQSTIESTTNTLASLNPQWTRLEVHWSLLENEDGSFRFDVLDQVLDSIENTVDSSKILLTVTSAPEWRRSRTSEDGPADNPEDFANFLSVLTTRYISQVDAIQIWNEPNLRREWSSDVYELNGAAYVSMLSVAYETIKSIAPDIKVITAGLAPTGFSDGVNAVSDRIYLQQMYDAGVESVSDAIAINPGSWANAPEARCCEAGEGVTSHYEDPSFYYLDTIEDYREIMIANGNDSPIWITKFGWATADGLSEVPAGYEYANNVTAEQQAMYLLNALEIGATLGYVDVMIVYNMNGCLITTSRPEICLHSLIAPDGNVRPAFNALEGAMQVAQE